MGLFGKKKSDFEFKSVNCQDRDAFFQLLKTQGWEEFEMPFEYSKDWPTAKLRKNARNYAEKQLKADMLVEVEDSSFSSNPYNNFVYYVFKKGGSMAPSSQANKTLSSAQQTTMNADQGFYSQQTQQTSFAQTNPSNHRPPTIVNQSATQNQYGQPNTQQYDQYGQPNTQQYDQYGQPNTQQHDPYNPSQAHQYDHFGRPIQPSNQGYDPAPAQSVTSAPTQEPQQANSFLYQYQKDEDGKIKVTDTKEMFLKANYTSQDEALYHCIDNMAKLLSMGNSPIRFTDRREFLHPIIRVQRGAYVHMGGRAMNIVLMKDAINDYSIIGNEDHSVEKVGGRRDNLILIKTLGAPTFQLMPDFEALSDIAKGQVAQALFVFLENFLPKFG